MQQISILLIFYKKKTFGSFRIKMTIKVDILDRYKCTNFVVYLFFLSGPSRLKNYLTSGMNNSDVDDNEVQESLSKL